MSATTLDRLCRLLPSQLELLIFTLGVNAALLPTSSQAERAIALLRLTAQDLALAQRLEAELTTLLGAPSQPPPAPAGGGAQIHIGTINVHAGGVGIKTND
jgi:hypothetical protein